VAEDKTLPDDSANHNGSIASAEQAEILAVTIKESREYHEYISAYNRLSHDEIEKLRAFKQTESQAPVFERMSFDEEKRISNLYTMLILNANIKSFIEKERAVCDMLIRVFDIAGDLHLFMFED